MKDINDKKYALENVDKEMCRLDKNGGRNS